MNYFLSLVFLLTFVCLSNAENAFPKKMTYNIRRVSENIPELTADWGAPAWKTASEARLLSFLPESTWTGADIRGRLLYDDQYIYGIFQVKDRYMQSTNSKINSSVCQDSCVEFFFSPGSDEKFFNIEMNHTGVILANFCLIPYQPEMVITQEDIQKYVKTCGSIPYLVKEEIEGPITWTLEFRIDRALIDKYYAPYGTLPKDLGGTSWTCNFYHCADKSSHPRWVAWSQVPVLAFHIPACFGILNFER